MSAAIGGGALPPLAPYAGLAGRYDRLVGDAGFPLLWRGFLAACERYRIAPASVADIGCGTGRVLAALTRRLPPGTPLLGVDRSPAMLAVARRRLVGTGVRLLRQDLRRLALPRRFDLLTCNFDTLNYLTRVEDLQLAIDSFARCMVFDGHLIFDILRGDSKVPPPSIQGHALWLPGLRGRWSAQPSAGGGGSVVVVDACESQEGGGPSRCWRETHRQRWWSLPLVRRLLEAAGLALLGVHRVGGPARAGPSDRWVQLVARRR